VSIHDGLVVVVPRGFDHDRVPNLLHKKRRWIEQASDRIEAHRKFFEPPPAGDPPERISLKAICQSWSVDYRPTASESVTTVERAGHRLLVYGDTDNVRACRGSLRRWLTRMTHRELVPWLVRLADEREFPLGRVLVKAQKTRWASCSKHRTVSLNSKLLFLPESLVRYVFVHELCHTRELTHSKRFWTLLEAVEPGFRNLDNDLRFAWRHLPAWVIHD